VAGVIKTTARSFPSSMNAVKRLSGRGWLALLAVIRACGRCSQALDAG